MSLSARGGRTSCEVLEVQLQRLCHPRNRRRVDRSADRSRTLPPLRLEWRETYGEGRSKTSRCRRPDRENECFRRRAEVHEHERACSTASAVGVANCPRRFRSRVVLSRSKRSCSANRRFSRSDDRSIWERIQNPERGIQAVNRQKSRISLQFASLRLRASAFHLLFHTHLEI